MASLYGILRRAWHGSPAWCRRVVERSRTLNRFRSWLSDRTISRARHEEIYDHRYYEMVDSGARRAAGPVVDFVTRQFQPKTVVDVGCGTGAMLKEFVDRGVRGRGFEYSEEGLRMCRQRGLDVAKFDLEKDVAALPDKADVVVSLEVAEHLPASCADRYVDMLCGAGDRIIFTAAPPGQGGSDHVNEQPPEYWIAKFAVRGFERDAEASAKASGEWKAAAIPEWYWRNVIVFRRVVPH